jgi:hypothetical protein
MADRLRRQVPSARCSPLSTATSWWDGSSVETRFSFFRKVEAIATHSTE